MKSGFRKKPGGRGKYFLRKYLFGHQTKIFFTCYICSSKVKGVLKQAAFAYRLIEKENYLYHGKN